MLRREALVTCQQGELMAAEPDFEVVFEQTAGDPTWRAAKRVEHGMAPRRAGTAFEGVQRG
jgi:hypothetical protein